VRFRQIRYPESHTPAASAAQEVPLVYPPNCKRCDGPGYTVTYADGARCLICSGCGRDMLADVPADHPLQGKLVSVLAAEQARQARQAAQGLKPRERGWSVWPF
jgi:hypothetical protein